MEDPILHQKRKFINVSFVAAMLEGFKQSTLNCDGKKKILREYIFAIEN